MNNRIKSVIINALVIRNLPISCWSRDTTQPRKFLFSSNKKGWHFHTNAQTHTRARTCTQVFSSENILYMPSCILWYLENTHSYEGNLKYMYVNVLATVRRSGPLSNYKHKQGYDSFSIVALNVLDATFKSPLGRLTNRTCTLWCYFVVR